MDSLCESRFWNRSINTVPYDFCVSSPLAQLRGRVYGALTQLPLTEHLRRRTYGIFTGRSWNRYGTFSFGSFTAMFWAAYGRDLR
jgi:hypothetical protein